MKVYVAIGWNSYTGDFMDEQEILGVFHSLEQANQSKKESLTQESSAYDRVTVEMHTPPQTL